MIDYIQIVAMKSGIKIFRSQNGIQFICIHYDDEFRRWWDGFKIYLPLEVAQRILKPELLEDEKK